jgi:hypothetical protein
MLSLHEAQRRFYDAIVTDEPAGLLPLVADRGFPAPARLAVYRNNAREGFRKALASTYPVVARLVGFDCFRQLAWSYACRYPSRSGNLDDFGRQFTNFLAERFGRTQFAYLSDVASLEWLCQEALLAKEQSPLTIADLAIIEAADYPSVRLSPNPSCKLVRSAYPIFQIWDANQPGSDQSPLIDLGVGGEQVLIRRKGDMTELRALRPSEFLFLQAIFEGHNLGRAVDAALSQDPAFPLQANLTYLFGLGLVVGVNEHARQYSDFINE